MKKEAYYPLLLLLIIPLLSLVYVLLNQLPLRVNNLYTDLDHAIPFVKGFILAYMVWMPFLYLTLVYFFFHDRSAYYQTLIAYTGSVLICYAIYLIFQTTVPRPELVGTDWLSRFVQFVYTNDAPYNCFPSIHCLSSYLLLRAAAKSRSIPRKAKLLIGIIAWLVIISTLFVKQHVVLDAAAGIMLGHAAYWAARRMTKLQLRVRSFVEREKSRMSI